MTIPRPLRLVLLSASLLFAVMGWAARGSHPGPKELVHRYLLEDHRGARLDKESKSLTRTAVTWATEPDEDRWLVTRSFRVESMKMRKRVAKVRVVFENLGEVRAGKFEPGGQREEATFDVVRKNGAWKIDRPILMPHVSPQAARSRWSGPESNQNDIFKENLLRLAEAEGKTNKQ